MSFTPFNAPLLSGFLGDTEIAGHFSIKADLAAMVQFEATLADVQSAHGVIPKDAAEAIAQACSHFEPDLPALQKGVSTDGMAVPEFVRQLRAATDEQAQTHVHFGSTSQDVVDTSLVLRLLEVNTILEARISGVLDALEKLDRQFGSRGLMARTRMQRALPVHVSDRIQSWRSPLRRSLDKFTRVKSDLHVVQCAGPVGRLDKLGAKGANVRASLAGKLGLGDPKGTWHTDRTRLADYMHWLNGVSSAVGKIGTDVALMAQNEIAEIKLSGAGGSSAMAHKQNPILAESLTTLSKYVSGTVASFQQNLIHEQERSGAAWTLEWMLIPQACVATGAALRNTQMLVDRITEMGEAENA